ncbi:glycosyltransferase family 4 protein [Cetobacterium sp.]|uniref:glycosyltransferase family 4 protein n=1 Tax=Cetobacterium sp. TaxID=2071632 RepID=UPI003F3C993E
MEEIKILALTNYYEEGPSSRYRSFNYEKYFLLNGIKIEYFPLFFDGYVKRLYSKEKVNTFYKIYCILKRIVYILHNKKKYNHIIIETELIKYAPLFFEKFLLKGASYSLDYDDNPNLIYKKNKIFKILYGQKILKLAKNARFITVGNKWFYKEIKTENIVYLPTVIDIDKYYITEKKKNNTLIIVWIGSPSTEKYLDIIKTPLKELSLKYDFELKIIGSEKKIEGVNVRNIKWEQETEIKEISNSDIGIMPLENTFWEKGKCGFKLIQYMACGLPVVASNSPANKEIVNGNGFILNEEKEWTIKLEKLLIDKELRKEMGKESRRIIEEKYTYQVWGKRYSQLIKNL